MLTIVLDGLEQGPPPQLDKLDSYQIAVLRGGESEAIVLAIFTLLDRGLLQENSGEVKVNNKIPGPTTRHMLEGKILELSRHWIKSDTLINDRSLIKIAGISEQKLQKKGLCASNETFIKRILPGTLALAILLGTAGYKLVLAIQRGKSNVGFLIFAAIISLVLIAGSVFQRRTSLGNETLSNLKNLFKNLYEKSHLLKSGQRTNDASQVAAVYGITALSANNFPYLKKIFKKSFESRGDSSACGTSFGSSCSSSCGSSCGSGCGGCGGD